MNGNRALLRGIWFSQLAILALAAYSIAHSDAESYGYAFNVYLAYLTLVTTLSWRDRQQAERLSDDAYFTGYVLTILGLIGIATRFGREADPLAEPAKIVEAGTTSLGATILGLLVRSLIRNLIPYPDANPLTDSSKPTPTQNIDYSAFFAQLTQCNKRLLYDLEKVRTLNIEAVQHAMTGCAKSITELDAKAISANATMADLIDHLKAIEIMLKTSQASMQANTTTFEAIAKAAIVTEGFAKSTSAATISTEGMSNAIQNAEKRTRSFVTTVDELKAVIENFTNNKVEEFKHFTPSK